VRERGEEKKNNAEIAEIAEGFKRRRSRNETQADRFTWKGGPFACRLRS
jgi:hypothetical protein